uniref:WD repeat domain phosphoinositide-interacting protein 2 n=1 Tax=Denticeps clupeoides TaxID=299321 RepID=A0AAY4BU88_9TELE
MFSNVGDWQQSLILQHSSDALIQSDLQSVVTGTVPPDTIRVKCLAQGHKGSTWFNLGLLVHRRVCYPLGYYHPLMVHLSQLHVCLLCFIKANNCKLIVCLEESLYIHNIRDMKVLHTIRETPPNPSGLCALSISNDNCYLAYPGSATIGEVQVFDTVNLRAANMIPAHDSPLAALAFDASGTKLATASEKGTVIRVFSIPEGQKLFEFRRGVKRCVSICSLAFSMEGLYLSASSNTETVHIFKLETQREKPQEEPTTWTGYFGKVLMASTTYLPSQVTEMFTQGRAFATVRLPFSGHKNICALAIIQKIPRLLVAAADGYLYLYNLDPQEGGECTLMKQHKLDGSAEPANEILEQTAHDRPLVAQTYSAAMAKGYSEDQGAVGGAGVEDDINALHLDEENEQPPLILETD